ncbi:ABC transporter permease [Aeromonas lusitana]|uniref:ABC transporter permease n=1 Tax=Aeromonas lusitana TaxID=931529 RepID=A0A2M8HCA7_9GAMM|nr:ABC transporter permease [Aeromonas lusitana]PJC94185.1 ABC transporter permease [Aeromonas lusitana]
MSGISVAAVLGVLGQRLVQALTVALLVAGLCFLLVQSLPGDIAFRIAAGRYGYDYVTAEAANAVRSELGLAGSALARFGDWLGALLQGDLGNSLVTGSPVASEIAHHLGATLSLALAAVALALLLALPLGSLSALRPGGFCDRLTLAWSVLMRALPPFLLGLVLMVLLSAELGWLSAAGHGEGHNLWLPALALGLGLSGVLARVVRESVLGVVQSEYYRFALTKGLSPARVFWRHGLRNSGVSIIAYTSVQLVLLIEGVVVVESLFAWPGIGHALVHAVFWRDVPMVQGTVLVLAALFVLLNTLTDLLCLLIDPCGAKES